MGDVKGGVWLYSTESNLTPDTAYSLAQQRKTTFDTSRCVHF